MFAQREKTQAGALLEELDLAGIYPVPVEQVLTQLGFTLNGFRPDSSTGDIAGAVDYGAKTVWVNVEDSPVRQRFTIAHEIGHIKLHAGDSVIDHRGNLANFTDGKEAEANRFAADLLMDPLEFVKAWFRLDCELVKVANYFGVSKKAAEIRAKSYRLS